MRKLIWQINVSLDGFADHTVVVADDDLFEFSTSQMDAVDTLLFGRVTYQLMEGWHQTPDDPKATKKMIEFANKFNAMPKVVFSRTLQKTARENEKLVADNVVEEITRLKQQSGKNLSITGLALPQDLMRHRLIDEYLLLLQPVKVGKGKRLFDGMEDETSFKLIETKTFMSGVIALRYAPQDGND
jgi:dihydrofolate reductase